MVYPSYQFRVWAPKAQWVELVFFESGEAWRQNGVDRAVPMARQERGWFELEVPDVPDGQLYLFRLPDGRMYPDPQSRWQTLGVHGPSSVFRPESFVWSDQAWTGVSMADLIVYELHVGTFNAAPCPASSGSSQSVDSDRYGTFASVAKKLAHLSDLGVTAIELMPVAQNPGKNWGYDGVYPFAVESSYGGPRELQKLVDAAHAVGLAVVLDCVYNHFGPEGCYLGALGDYYDARFTNPWGEAINFCGPNCDPVRQFVTDNAAYWIREFHIDGLRLDATDTIIDLSGRHILADISETVRCEGRQQGRSTFTVAEDDDNNQIKLLRQSENGYQLEGVWNIDFHHALHAVLTGERDGYYADFDAAVDWSAEESLLKAFADGWVYTGQYRPSRERNYGTTSDGLPPLNFVVYSQNHDQVGNYPDSQRLNAILPESGARLMASLVLMSPFVPMLFMGEEYGERKPFPFFTWFENPSLVRAVRQGRQRDMEFMHRRKLPKVRDPFTPQSIDDCTLSWQSDVYDFRLALYKALIGLRKKTKIAGQSFKRFAQGNDARLIYLDGQPKVLMYRWRVSGLGVFFTLANLTREPVALSWKPPSAERIFSSEWPQFGGDRQETTSDAMLLPNELSVWVGVP